MATIYVAKTGNDSNAGTDPASPKLTIQAAVDDADDSAPSVVIILDSQTYAEQIKVGTDSGFTPNDITIKGDDGQLPVLDGAGGGLGGIRGAEARNGDARTVTVQNMKFIRHGGSNGGVFKGNGSATDLGLAFAVSDCEFDSNTSYIFNRTGGDSSNHSSANRCKFTENTMTLVRQHGSTGDKFLDFTNCVFGIKAGTEGIDFGSGKNNGTVRNCSFVADINTTDHIVRAGVIENTVVQNLASSAGTVIGIEANFSRSNNATFGNFATDQTGGTDGGNNLTGQDPQFTDTTLADPDLAIPATSPLAEAGKTISSITTDFIGTARPQDVAYDIGAYEALPPAFADYTVERKLQGSPDNDGGLLTLSSPTQLVGAGDDGTTAYPVTLGFTFNFNEVAYTSVKVFVDGVVCFGGTECANGYTHPHGEFDDAKNLISLHPWNAQVRTAYSTGYVKYELQGAAPNRKMVIEWRVHTSNNQSSINNQTISYQVVLEETTDKIQFRYGPSSVVGSVAGGFAPKNAVIGARIDTTSVINGNIREFTELTGTPDPNGGVSTTPVELTVQALTEYPGSDSNTIESAAFNFHFSPPVPPEDWSDYGEETELKFSSSFIVNKNANFSKNHKFDSDNELRQAPFSLAIPGPASLRGRRTPYKNET